MTLNRARKAKATRREVEDTSAEARLAVNLPVQLHRQLKAKAAEQGSSIRDFILELLKKNGIS
jgi:hypothetical protein